MSTSKYSWLFENFRKKTILVVGDLILDHYIWGLVDRISPEAPVPVIDMKRENFVVGGAANVAANIVALGGRAAILGVKGTDLYGEVLTSLLKERGIETSGIFECERCTTVKTRVIAHNQQVVRIDKEERGAHPEDTLKKMLDYIDSGKGQWDGVIISDYKKGVISHGLMKTLRKYKKNGCFVSVDPKVGHFDYYTGVSIITPNLKEAQEGSGVEITDNQSLKEAGRKLLSRLKCDAVLITRGEHGMSLFEKNSVVHIPTVAKSVYDVTGAGDSVIATMTLAHVAGCEISEAALIANHAAGIVVGQVGTATASVADLELSLRENNTKLAREKL